MRSLTLQKRAMGALKVPGSLVVATRLIYRIDRDLYYLRLF